MKKRLLPLIAATLLGACSATNNVAKESRVDVSDRVVITWSKPSDYTDIREANGNSPRFHDTIFKKLHRYVDEMAQDLPPGHTLKMVVTDLDLAGRIVLGSMHGFRSQQEVRLVKHTSFPTMEFSFELTDATGAVVLSGERAIKNMALQQSIKKRTKMPALGHERWMLEKWFHTEIDSTLASL